MNTAVLTLTGTARERGLAQARTEPASTGAVRDAVAARIEPLRERLASASLRTYLEAQWRFHEAQAPDELAEMTGVAEGYGIDARTLFAYLHLGVLGDLGDGCTVWARSSARGAMLAKNRDVRSEHRALQRVFRHRDPDWGRRTVLAVGSIGSPGAYSSGINSAGLALADTAAGTRDHGIGLLRYFLMTRILARAGDVDGALDLVRATRHAGGGTLALADRHGAVAAVELGHRAIAIERAARGSVARTNHFVGPETAADGLPPAGDPTAANSVSRLGAARAALDSSDSAPSVEVAFALMGSHDSAEANGLCRHGRDGEASTISCTVFATDPPTLYFCPGAPCETDHTEISP
jgi:isopenicillin-N N-acyltransferase-like protein